jgi:hypothetical protein
MRAALFIGVASLTLWGGLAKAADDAALALKTTEDLYRVCTTDSSDPRQREDLALCEGFLAGVVSYHDAVVDMKNLKRLICYPSSVTRDDGIRAFVDWAALHQQDKKYMNDPAVAGAVRGLATKWPCSQTR